MGVTVVEETSASTDTSPAWARSVSSWPWVPSAWTPVSVSMLGAFMSRIGFRFGAIGSPAFFDFGMLFVGKLRYFRSVRILRFASRFGLFFFVFFLDFFLNLSFDFLYFVHFFVFKDGAASQSIHFRVLLHLFLLGFHDAGSQRRDLVVV